MVYNFYGLKYFIYNITKNNIKYLELPEDVRKLIWKFAHTNPLLKCYICDNVLINLEINILDNIQNENFCILNGITRCNSC